MKNQRTIGCLARLATVAMLLAFASSTAEAIVYDIVAIGLTDTEHTRNDGYGINWTNDLNEAGQVVGRAQRYNGGSVGLGVTSWLYTGSSTINIGLTDTEHTRNDGYKGSWSYDLNEAGQVVGFAGRFNEGSVHLGHTVWLFTGSSTINIGLTDAEHTRDDGYKDSWTDDEGRFPDFCPLNEAGQVLGHSRRFNGGSVDWGQTAWLYTGSSTISIGLTDTEHTRNDGYEDNWASDLNEAGQVVGHSRRFNGGSVDLGQTAWLYTGSSTINIGLTDTEHTRNDEHKQSWVDRLNEAGQVLGSSRRFNGGSVDLGQTAWLYTGSSTINIGLTDTEHTRNDGYKESSGGCLNEAGQVVGCAQRFNGGSVSLGDSAWLYTGSSTINIGLTGTEHTRNDGYKYSWAYDLNEAGQVLGRAQRFNGGSVDLGHTVWLFTGSGTINIGLADTEHTRNDEYKESSGFDLNETGQVLGSAHRFNGGSVDLGLTAWLYTGSTTINIGLTDTEHTRNDGYKESQAVVLNEAGQVVGRAQRFNGGSVDLGQDAWFYDPTSDETLALTLSVRSDGYASSWANYLGEDGLVLGHYTLFDDMDDLGDRAFVFTLEDGLFDLGSMVEGGLDEAGWQNLANTYRANGTGQIIGYGLLEGMPSGQMTYLLTPAVPEPSTAALLLTALAVCLTGRVLRGMKKIQY